MNQEEQEHPMEAAAEALGCLLMFVVVILIMWGLPAAGIFTLIEKVNEHNAELQQERHEIEGLVKAVEVTDVPPPPTLDEINEKREEEGKSRINFYYDAGPHYKHNTKITFEDGRFMDFRGVTAKPIEIGKYYIITYNGLKEIVDFTIADFQATMKEDNGSP